MTASKAKPKAKSATKSPAKVGAPGDWRTMTLEQVRRLILEADPEIVEERKWAKPTKPEGVPAWSRDGIVCTGETYKQVVKLTFAKGASLDDPNGLFNSSLDGNTRLAIDIREGESIDAQALIALVRSAVAGSLRGSAKPKGPAKPVKLLSGGNPRIAKADGDEPVQAFIEAMPGWKRDIGRRLDELIVRTVPNARKAMRWNTPFYGIEGKGWFLGFHCITKYVKVAFFKGASLRPVPPGQSKQKDVRYLDIYGGDGIDEAQAASWIKQASELPGEELF